MTARIGPQTRTITSGRSDGSGSGAVREVAHMLSVVPDNPAPVTSIHSIEDVHAILEQENEVLLASNVFQYIHVVKIENRGDSGRLEVALDAGAPPSFAQSLGPALTRISGQRWIVSVAQGNGQPTMAQKASAAAEAEKAAILALPVMKDILNVFPDAEYLGISQVEDTPKEGNT